MEPLVILEQVRKIYRRPWRFSWHGIVPAETTEALSGVSFEMHGGEICGLLGVNGAGKTTLIKILASLVTPDGGRVFIDGCDLVKNSARIRALVGHINTNERSFYWRLSGRMNLEFFATLYNLSGNKRQGRVRKMLELVNMTEHAEKRFMTYSTGQKQRLAIARALLAGPKVILLDEPTSSLDLVSASRLRAFIREKVIRGTERAALWCTHNLQEAQEVCDRILVLHQGKIVADFTRAALEDRVATSHRYRFSLAPCSLHQLSAAGLSPLLFEDKGDRVEIELAVRRDELSAVLRRLLDLGISVFGFQAREASLETVFRQLVNGAVP